MSFVANPFDLSGGNQQLLQFIALRAFDDLIGFAAVMNLDWRQVAEVISRAIERQLRNRGEELDNSADCYARSDLRSTQGEVTAEREAEQAELSLVHLGRPAGREFQAVAERVQPFVAMWRIIAYVSLIFLEVAQIG